MAANPSQLRMHKYRWLGSQVPHLDQPSITRCGQVVVGCYGGNTAAGAHKNEDGALVWCEAEGDWEFSMLLDAHNTAESAGLLLKTVEIESDALLGMLCQPVSVALPNLSQYIISRFQSPAFRARCKYTKGETACLICARKDRFLWWLSVGDCVAYTLHPELARLGQFALNQRSFYEWIGQVNTFELPVPSFSSGVKELRQGPNHIVMTTDGLYDVGGGYYQDPRNVYKDFTFWDHDLEASVRSVLMRVHHEKGLDSTTVVTWRYVSQTRGTEASKPI